MKTYSLPQKIGLFFLGLILSGSVSLFIVTSMANRTVFSRDFISELATSELAFEGFGTTVAESIQQDTPVLETEEIQTIVTDQIDLQHYQNSANQLVDSLFDWLDGTAETIDFNISIAPDDTNFRNLLDNLLVARLTALPVCESAIDNQQVLNDPFEASCRPQAFDEQSARNILNTVPPEDYMELYESATITDEDLELNQEDIQQIPTAFGVLHTLPVVFLITALISATGVFMVIRKRDLSLRFVGRSLMIPSGSILLLGLLIILFLNIPAQAINNSLTDPQLPQAAVQGFVDIIEQTLLQLTLLYAGSIFVIGLAMYFAGRASRGFEPGVHEHHVHAETKRADFSHSSPESTNSDKPSTTEENTVQ